MKKHKSLKEHHAKPVRKRHIGVSFLGMLLITAAAYVLGLGSTQIIDSVSSQETKISPVNQSTTVRSSLGFSFEVDQNLFDVAATKVVDGSAEVIKSTDLSMNNPLASVSLRANIEKVRPADSASSLEIRVVDNRTLLAGQFANKSDDVTVEQVVADYFKPESSVTTSVTQLSSRAEVVAGLNLEKRVYQFNTNLGGQINDAQTFAVYWSGLVNQKPINIQIRGLVGGSNLPQYYKPVLDSLKFDLSVAAALNSDITPVRSKIPGFGTAGAEAETLDNKYIADLVSPSVVKIYSGVCGNITVSSGVQLDEICDAGTGTGFIVSDNGVIATNGHVVISGAEDLLVKLLLSDTNIFIAFLTGAGLDNAEVEAVLADQNSIASVIADIYDAPEDLITLSNEERKIFVALGDDVIDMETSKQFFETKQTKSIKEARVLASDYASRDVYSAQFATDSEFTASDVALLKISVSNAPSLVLASSEPIQNEPITVLGFPGDAENSLVDDDTVAVSITKGVISSIRDANGSNSKLYQSDVDASSGNSGGPAINESGEVIGLLTYRYKNDSQIDASKSYIRDIDDLVDLAEDENIKLGGDSGTMALWQNGLELYSQSRFSKAKKEFEAVKEAYPAHRLAGTYINRSQTAIDEGRDVKDFPIALAIIGGTLGTGLLALGVFLFFRHNKHHKLHLLSSNQSAPNVPMPGQTITHAHTKA